MTAARAALAIGVGGLTLLEGLVGLFAGLTIAAGVELVTLWVAVTRRGSRDPARRSETDGRSGRATAAHQLASYRRVRNEVSGGLHAQWEYDHGLRRRLRRILAVRLLETAGVDLDRQPERARDLLGAELWPLVDPRAAPTDDRDRPGVSAAALDTLVDRLERM